jgi:septal ring factor EnvC (AmiA/AmiB activator)
MKLQPGSRVTILEHTGLWLKISYNGQTGYVRNKPHYIKIESHHEIGADPPAAPKHLPDQATSKNIDHLKHTAAEISDEIEKSEVRVLKIKKEERAVVSRLNDIDLRLDRYGRRLRKLKSDLRVLDQRITKKSKAIEALERDIQSNELYAAKRLVALYKLTWLGHLPVLGSAESLYEFVQRKSSLQRILVHDENIIESLVAQKKSLQTHLQEIQDQKKEQRAVEKQLDQQIQNISIEKNKRTHLLREIRSQHSLELAAIEALKKSAQDLDQKITFFTTQSESEPRRTEPPEGQPFIAAKGLLNLPVDGKIVSFFGPFKNTKYNVVNYQSGINIKADRGEPIQAVHAGRVLFANWFKGYGNMIILDHGDHYYTVYAHAEEVFKAKGDLVEAGEVIATVGDSGSMIGPALHFEVRHHGKPEDPLNWIKKG